MNDGQANTKNGNIRTGPVRQADRATAAWLAVALAALTPALAHGETPAASAVPAAHAAANTGHKHAVLTYPGIRLSLPSSAATETAAEETPIRSDVIDRIRDGFAMPQVERREIETQRNWYARHPDYMERVLLRSQRYLFWIVEEVERRGMPTELALLPIVESAFDPFAYSHGRAAGLWQIIPGTGKRFGLKQNWWYDGRRDPVASTRAALDYLEKLHADFDGDWLLAVAAYNSGEGNVMRAQRRNRKAGKPTDFWNLKLPVETEAYVPKLLALQQLIGDPQRFGLELPSVANQPYFAVVELSAQIDLALAAELAGIEMDELYALNAGFNRWATDPDGPMRIQVPVAASERFRSELAALPEGQQVRWVRYKIRSGDALSLIAKRHDTTADVLRQINDIRGNNIRAGDYLMIPTATRSLDNYSQSAAERLARLQNRPRGATRSVHVVRTGESLWTISQRYGVGTRSLAKWNGMAPGDTLSVGRELVVWSGKTASGNGNSAKVRKVHYTVRKGDSLARIAGKFRVTIGDLKNWNQSLAGKKYLQPGQRIVMYVDVTRQSGV
ncbi:MAG: LysM peptidoglycan-binding domain-containing protein [Chromatiales bacterium]|jgi:membrane-bound lytic murein transglycosylase D|nr:LysM peptidoglycan-binding domain-containing protein [Chromatiales bacterium]MDH4013893.1 LysM peptidoglycan-binding domain-containing protein [Chromatiales bacterium]